MPQLYLIAMILIFQHPSLIALLDFLLCVHRLSVVFCECKFFTQYFRWTGPLLFLIIAPLMLIATLIASTALSIHSDGSVSDYFVRIQTGLKAALSVLTFSGYSLILIKSRSKQTTNANRRDYSVILRQALPIASFQWCSVIILGITQIPFEDFEVTNVQIFMINIALSCMFYIVVPISIIVGNNTKRRLFLNSFCCFSIGNSSDSRAAIYTTEAARRRGV
ncbi:unnamed protein product [Caenorhabditis bovis]|uniref:Uncharacterized protein n=1 Tax=Caenorhabditis bovis TaxID=2654633 RepID=A0A8S1F600_9PELO|nr:unnamed protein product [Caenorhabditis bovis]